MFPGLDLFFVAAFACVVAAIAAVVTLSLARARRDLATGRAESIRWSTDFGDLPLADRPGSYRDDVDERDGDRRSSNPVRTHLDQLPKFRNNRVCLSA